MSLVGWLVVLGLPVYAGVQLVVLVVLAKRLTLRSGDVALSRPPGGVAGDAVADPRSEPTESPRGCPTCGQPNDFSYTYCRSCLSRLPVAVWVDVETA